MAGPIRISVLADASQASREFKSVSQDAGGMGSAFKTAAKVAAAAMVVAGAAVVKFGIDSVQAASAAEQSLGATETVFGKFAGQVIKTSNRAAEQFGLSADEYRNNANVLGSLFKNQGVALDQLGGKTKSMIGTAADLAATFGGTTAEAVQALGSAFKGEFDPLEKYGISIKAATISTAAWAIAGVDSAKAFGELTAQEQAHAKQLATTDLLMGQAAQTMGAFAKESDTLAHQQQVLGARFDNLKARVGKALLPVVTDLFKVVNRNLMPALNALADKVLPPITKALQGWVRSGGAADLFDDISRAVSGFSWDSFTDGLGQAQEMAAGVEWGELVTVLGELGDALQSVSADAATDTISVFNEVVGFAADHTDLLAKALPFLATAFVIVKGAQAANAVAGRDSIIGLGLQLVATQRLTVATRELAAAQTASAGATGRAASASKTAATTMGRFQGATRLAAGAGGLGLLVSSAGDTGGALDTLKTTAGGALTGFAVGGPWGAAIGGAVGLFGSLITSTDDAAAAAQQAVPDWSSLAGTLDQVTGAITAATRAQTVAELAQKGAFDQAAKLGISKQVLVDATLGERDALVSVTKARQAQTDAVARLQAEEAALIASRKADPYGTNANDIRTRVEAIRQEVAARKTNLAWLDKTLGSAAEQRKSARELLRLTTDWDKALKGLPERAITQVEAKGIPATLKSIARLAAKYDLTPKQIKTVLSAANVDKTVADVKRVQKALDDTGKRAPKPKVSVDSIPANRDLSTVTKKIEEFGKKAPKPTASINDQASAPLDSLNRQLTSLDLRSVTTDVYVVTHRRTEGGGGGGGGTGGASQRLVLDAKKQAEQTRKDLLEGIATGLFLGPQEIGPIESAMAADVDALLGRIEDRYTARGEQAAQNIEQRFNRQGRRIEASFDKLRGKTKKWAKEAEKTKSKKDDRQAAQALEDLDAAERKRLRKLEEREKAATQASNKAWRERAKAAKAAIGSINAALVANARLQDDANARLAVAQDALEAIQEQAADFAAGIKSSFTALANVVGLGVREVKDAWTGEVTTTKVSATTILADLKDRLALARKFAADIQALVAAGLDESVIRDLLAAGPEAASETAAAIAAGGPAAIAEINQVTRDLAATGEALGTSMSQTYYAAGIASAQATVDGINAELAALVAAEQVLLASLAGVLAEEGKKRGKGAGTATGQGLYEGLVNNEKVTQAGEKVARQLIRAFRDELRISSPSKVFQELGELTGEGLTIGLDKTPAAKAGAALASDLVSGFGDPTLSAQAALGSGALDARQGFTITLTAAELDQLARGRAIQADLDAYARAGGRRTT